MGCLNNFFLFITFQREAINYNKYVYPYSTIPLKINLDFFTTKAEEMCNVLIIKHQFSFRIQPVVVVSFEHSPVVALQMSH